MSQLRWRWEIKTLHPPPPPALNPAAAFSIDSRNFQTVFLEPLVPTDGDISPQSPPFNPLFTCFPAHKPGINPQSPPLISSLLCVCVCGSWVFLVRLLLSALEIQQLVPPPGALGRLWRWRWRGLCSCGRGCTPPTPSSPPPHTLPTLLPLTPSVRLNWQ